MYTKTQSKKVSRHIGEGVGFIERVIEVNTFCRLGMLFAAGAKTNDINEKCTLDGLVFGCDSGRAMNNNVACFVGMLDDVLLCFCY